MLSYVDNTLKFPVHVRYCVIIMTFECLNGVETSPKIKFKIGHLSCQGVSSGFQAELQANEVIGLDLIRKQLRVADNYLPQLIRIVYLRRHARVYRTFLVRGELYENESIGKQRVSFNAISQHQHVRTIPWNIELKCDAASLQKPRSRSVFITTGQVDLVIQTHDFSPRIAFALVKFTRYGRWHGNDAYNGFMLSYYV